MGNDLDFSKRLQKVIDFYDETASSFAQKIGVQRSSISHILSARNKPSLDFVMKLLTSYPDVELYWLMNGKGNFPSQLEKPKHTQKSITSTKDILKTENNSTNKNQLSTSQKTIESIVIFYTDGSFKHFKNE